MNNDRKQMISEEPASDHSKAAKEMQQKFLVENGTEILLPEHVTMTPEILKNNICRICATYHESGPKLVPLYLYDEGSRPLALIINAFLPIQVSESDGLPRVACRSCCSKLHAWRAMWDSCAETQRVLASQAELLNGEAGNAQPLMERNAVKSLLTRMVQNVLASYLVNISSMELVCQVCHWKTSREEFHQHLNSNHEDLKSQDDIEAFVREHVTFEETLDSDGDGASLGSADGSEVSRRFHCSTCHTEFSTRSRLSLHLRTHNASGMLCCSNETEQGLQIGSNNLACKGCDHIAADPASIAGHIAQGASTHEVTGDPHEQTRDETNQKRIPAVCPECNRTFSNKYNMLNHLKSHGRQAAKFECECGKSYSTRGNLVAHRRTAHLGELAHRCQECGEGFPTRAARDIHARLHSDVRPYSCTVCSRAFRAKNSLDKHRETHAPRQFECALCGRRFRRKAHLRSAEGSPERDSDASSDPAPPAHGPLAALRRALRRLRDHYAAHHLPPPHTPPASPSPAATAEDAGDLDRYDDLTRDNMRRDRFDPETRRALDAARRRSEGRTLYECATCGRRLASPHAFVHHARIHTGERPHVCHVCGGRFRAPQGLARHLAETHERRRRRACRLCRATFANRQNLRQHLRTHTGERPHRCAVCGRRFAQSGALHAHARTHSPRRPHACELCPAAFRLRAGLARHARRHAGARPHTCACGRAFHARHELRAHLPAHLPAAPHACALCPAAYRLRRALRDHARRKHPGAPPPPLTRASFAGTAPTPT